MRKLVAVPVLAAVAALGVGSAGATAPKPKWEVVLLHADNPAAVEACLAVAGAGYRHEEEEIPLSEVISDTLYPTKRKARRAAKHAPMCNGHRAVVEEEEPG